VSTVPDSAPAFRLREFQDLFSQEDPAGV